jgi:hypothetical protein
LGAAIQEHFDVRQKIVEAMNSMSPGGGIDFGIGVGGPTFADQLESINPKAKSYLFRRKTGTGLSASDVLKTVELGTT